MESIETYRCVLLRFARILTAYCLRPRPDRVIFCAALFSFLSGCAAELAWFLGYPRLLTLGAGYPMHMDTGLFCIAASLGLFAVMRERFRISRFFGILIAVSANLHFAADLAGFSISIHNWMPPGTADVLSPVEAHCIQIAPATAVVFFLFGCGLTLLSKNTSDLVLGAVAALGTVITSTCVIDFLGYQAQFIGFPLQTNSIARMSMLTILCASFLGIGLCAMLWKQSGLTRHDLSTSGAALTVIGLILLVGGIDDALFVSTKAARTTTSGLNVTAARIKAIKMLVDSLRKAESGERGFLLTENEMFLATYLSGMADLKTSLDNPELNAIPQLKSHDLQNLIMTRMTELASNIQMQRRGRHQQAVNSVKTGAGLALMNQTESEAAYVTRILQAEATEQAAVREQSIQLVAKTVVASYLVAVILIALALYLVCAEIKCRNAVERALRENEISLERRVEERTQALHAEIAIRTAAEEQLYQARKLLDAALSFGGIAAWVWDCNEDRLCWTGNMQEIFERSSSELDTLSKFSSFIHPNDRSRIVEKIATSVTSGAVYNEQFRILLPHGKYRWISGVGAVVRDESGLIIHMAGINSSLASLILD